MNNKLIILLLSALVLLTGCSRQKDSQTPADEQQESREAKAMLQGIWLDDETENVTLSVRGDTIFYSDSTSMPAYFKIVGDSLVFATGTKYGIVKQTENLFWFKNQNGDVVKLRKSVDPDDAEFIHDAPPVLSYTHQVKRDSVVSYGGERYHWYVAINPTRYRVTKPSYTDDGMEVENVYYDNIIHISLFKGAQKLFSRDIKKQLYAPYVPAEFLEQAILGNMQYSSIDKQGVHFNATLCIPDGVACYMISTDISFGGQLSMQLVEY
jgi:hypothetical protein